MKRYQVAIKAQKTDQVFLDIEAESDSHAHKIAKTAIFNMVNDPKLKQFDGYQLSICNVKEINPVNTNK